MNASIRIIIYTDGNAVYNKVLMADSLPDNINIDCKNVDILKIQTIVEDEFKGKNSTFYFYAYFDVFLGEAYFKLK